MPPSASAIPPTQTTQRVPNRSSKPICCSGDGEEGGAGAIGTDAGGGGGGGGVDGGGEPGGSAAVAEPEREVWRVRRGWQWRQAAQRALAFALFARGDAPTRAGRRP